MPWIELLKPAEIDGEVKPAGYRKEVPRFAAQALMGGGTAEYVDGPRKREDTSDYAPAPPGWHEEHDDRGLREKAEEIEPVGEEEPEDGDALTVSEFRNLEKDDQKDLIRALGLADDCDLRSTESMIETYRESLE